MGVGKPDALFGQSVDVGSWNLCSTVAAEVAIAHIVSHKEDDVGLVFGCFVFGMSGDAKASRRSQRSGGQTDKT